MFRKMRRFKRQIGDEEYLQRELANAFPGDEAIFAADDAITHLKRARECLDSAGKDIRNQLAAIK